ncbi:hypothetical protein [Collinsella tanakaei]|uniref:hypothetical protein n=1 Tax=Collinsella tanakaei TaxID=626935 RepID=UPI0022E13369|nr:hypothetical protein [Collinsella tanakaei]
MLHEEARPLVLVVSDSLGDTAFAVLRAARALMGRIGCMVIKTDRKAIEESAAEIIGHLDHVLSQRSTRECGSAK